MAGLAENCRQHGEAHGGQRRERRRCSRERSRRREGHGISPIVLAGVVSPEGEAVERESGGKRAGERSVNTDPCPAERRPWESPRSPPPEAASGTRGIYAQTVSTQRPAEATSS